jgi:hypothetical protein
MPIFFIIFHLVRVSQQSYKQDSVLKYITKAYKHTLHQEVMLPMLPC